MNHSTPGLPVHHKPPEFTQTHAHRVTDAIQPSHPLSSPSPPAPNPSQHQGLFQWVNSSHEVAKVLEFLLQHQSFQWTPRTDLLQDGLVGSPCSPRDSPESSPTPQFRSINSSVLSFLHSPALTSIRDHWETIGLTSLILIKCATIWLLYFQVFSSLFLISEGLHTYIYTPDTVIPQITLLYPIYLSLFSLSASCCIVSITVSSSSWIFLLQYHLRWCSNPAYLLSRWLSICHSSICLLEMFYWSITLMFSFTFVIIFFVTASNSFVF